MEFKSDLVDNIIIQYVKLKRATKAEAEKFKGILFNHFEGGHKKIIVDLSECEFIDSTFLSILVLGLKEVSKVDGSIYLVVKNSEVQALIDITGINKVFKIFETKKAALSDFKVV